MYQPTRKMPCWIRVGAKTFGRIVYARGMAACALDFSLRRIVEALCCPAESLQDYQCVGYGIETCIDQT